MTLNESPNPQKCSLPKRLNGISFFAVLHVGDQIQLHLLKNKVCIHLYTLILMMTVTIMRKRFFSTSSYETFAMFCKTSSEGEICTIQSFFNRNHIILDSNLYSSHLMLKPYFKELSNYFVYLSSYYFSFSERGTSPKEVNEPVNQTRQSISAFQILVLPSTCCENLRQGIRLSSFLMNCLTHTKPCLSTFMLWGNYYVSLAVYRMALF